MPWLSVDWVLGPNVGACRVKCVGVVKVPGHTGIITTTTHFTHIFRPSAKGLSPQGWGRLLTWSWVTVRLLQSVSVCCAAVRFVIVALLFYWIFTLLSLCCLKWLIPTIFLVLSIKLIWSLASKTTSAAH